MGKIQRPPQGEFRAPAASKSDHNAEKVQPSPLVSPEPRFPLNQMRVFKPPIPI
jgi:hypothetical protein